MIPVMTPVRELETKALTLAEEAKALAVIDQPSYQLAAERLLAVVSLRHEIEQHHGPMKKAAHTAWQEIIIAERRLLEPVAAAEQAYKSAISVYETEQRRLQAEARERAEAAARRQAEERREQELERAEAEGADVEEITAMIAAPLPVIRPEGPPVFQSATGISTSTSWKAEVTSLSELVKAVAAGQANISLVKADEVALGQLARATRGSLEVPGVRFFNQATVRAGRR